VQRGGERSANFRIVFVDRLRDVEVELFAGGHADVKAITFDRLQDLLGVPIEDSLRTLKRRILQTGQSE
jgi:predicted HTH domain antitoxin